MSSAPLPRLFTSPRPREEQEFTASLRSLDSSSCIATGLKELDQLLKGGVPRGKITEITGDVSSGKTSLVFSILEQVTTREEWAAYIDTFDSLDPESAQKSGIHLDRLLWIRCRRLTENRLSPIEKALKAADLLTKAGGFGSIVLDIDGPTGRTIPLHAWFRLQRAIEWTPTGLLVLSRQKSAGSAASLLLFLERGKSCWDRRRRPVSQSRCGLSSSSGERMENRFAGIESSAYLLRGKAHGSVTIHCRF